MRDEAILTINAGSSSIKFSVFDRGADVRELGRGQVESLGSAACLVLPAKDGETTQVALGQADHTRALREILAHLAPITGGRKISGVGHRIVHGGAEFSAPQILSPGVLTRLERFKPLAPLHQPFNLEGVRAAQAAFGDAIQIGCFDTAFHRGHPWEHDTYAIPRAYYDKGVRRYGFHGLSYDFVSGELARLHPELATGRVIIAHLGNGASMCALSGGKSHSSTMGFSPLEGLPMGTRCGAIDPGVLLYLLEQEGMEPAAIGHLLYKESGLLGLSGLSHDMRRLLASTAPEAAQAVSYYVTRIRREIGAMAVDLGGLDALVFTGGVGENSEEIRTQVGDGLGWLLGDAPVLVIPTDEERVIARAVDAVLAAH